MLLAELLLACGREFLVLDGHDGAASLVVTTVAPRAWTGVHHPRALPRRLPARRLRALGAVAGIGW